MYNDHDNHQPWVMPTPTIVPAAQYAPPAGPPPPQFPASGPSNNCLMMPQAPAAPYGASPIPQYGPPQPTPESSGLAYSWNPLSGPPNYVPPPASTYSQTPNYNQGLTGASPHAASMSPSQQPTEFPGSDWREENTRKFPIKVTSSYHNSDYQQAGSYAARPHMPPHKPQPITANGTQQGYFEYSQCTGKKRALCIGINYQGTPNALRGCINDALEVKKFLIRRFGYKEENIRVLRDDVADRSLRPTKANILQGMRWLVQGAQHNDSLWFHFSGHGTQVKESSHDRDEIDGYDEAIVPLDSSTSGLVTDDTMHDILVKPLPAGCRLTAIFDSCHSGSSLDLPYIYSTEGKIKEPNTGLEAGKSLINTLSAYKKRDMGGVISGVGGILKAASGGHEKIQQRARDMKFSPADVITWSGCKDSQTSADAVEAGKATGAMSHAFIQAFDRQHEMTYQQILVAVRDTLRFKYAQRPQLSSSHPMDTSILFIA